MEMLAHVTREMEEEIDTLEQAREDSDRNIIPKVVRIYEALKNLYNLLDAINGIDGTQAGTFGATPLMNP